MLTDPSLTLPLPRGGNPTPEMILLPSPCQGEGLGVRSALQINPFQTVSKDNERHRGKFDKAAYRLRNQVERCFNRLKQFRRVATRYEKKAENYLAVLTIASIILWL
jgi:Transposase DDE domain